MAIVILGQTDIFVGDAIFETNSFAYKDNKAYALYVEFTSTNFSNLFSFIRIYPYIQPNGGTARLDSRYFDVEITDLPQLLLYPLTDLFDGNGDVSFRIERRSFYYGGGDSELVNVKLLYDDDLDTKSWL